MAATLTVLGIIPIGGLRRGEVRVVPNNAYWNQAIDAGYAELYTGTGLPGGGEPALPQGVLFGSDIGVLVPGFDGQGRVLDRDGNPVVSGGGQDGTGVVSIADPDGDGVATVTLTDGTTSALPLPPGPPGTVTDGSVTKAKLVDSVRATLDRADAAAPLESPAFTGTPTLNGQPFPSGGSGSAGAVDGGDFDTTPAATLDGGSF